MSSSIPPFVRRRLRIGLGSRVQRRAGVKSHKHSKPRQLLAAAIEKWLAAGRPELRKP